MYISVYNIIYLFCLKRGGREAERSVAIDWPKERHVTLKEFQVGSGMCEAPWEPPDIS